MELKHSYLKPSAEVKHCVNVLVIFHDYILLLFIPVRHRLINSAQQSWQPSLSPELWHITARVKAPPSLQNNANLPPSKTLWPSMSSHQEPRYTFTALLLLFCPSLSI